MVSECSRGRRALEGGNVAVMVRCLVAGFALLESLIAGEYWFVACLVHRATKMKVIGASRPVLKHGPRSLTCVRVFGWQTLMRREIKGRDASAAPPAALDLL